MSQGYAAANARQSLADMLLREGFTDCENGALELLVEAVALMIRDVGSHGGLQAWQMRVPGFPPAALDDMARVADHADNMDEVPPEVPAPVSSDDEDSVSVDAFLADGLSATVVARGSVDQNSRAQARTLRRAARGGTRELEEPEEVESPVTIMQPQQTLWDTSQQDDTAVATVAKPPLAPFRLKRPVQGGACPAPHRVRVAQPSLEVVGKNPSPAPSDMSQTSPKAVGKNPSPAEMSQASPRIAAASPEPPGVGPSEMTQRSRMAAEASSAKPTRKNATPSCPDAAASESMGSVEMKGKKAEVVSPMRANPQQRAPVSESDVPLAGKMAAVASKIRVPKKRIVLRGNKRQATMGTTSRHKSRQGRV